MVGGVQFDVSGLQAAIGSQDSLRMPASSGGAWSGARSAIEGREQLLRRPARSLRVVAAKKGGSLHSR